nr:aspartic proteinase-like protein 2 [Quercus suber]
MCEQFGLCFIFSLMPIPVVIGILVGLYFAKLGLGSPPKDYYVQVDTGSDILWVNCVGYKSCPKKSGLGLGSSFGLQYSS